MLLQSLSFFVLNACVDHGYPAERDELARTTALISARLLLRGAAQNLLTYLLHCLEQLYAHRQLRRNAPYPRARRIYSRPMMPG
jgi:hypothetical protein